MGISGLFLVATACSGQSTSTHGRGSTRTVDITMTDNKFQPNEIKVNKGETVTFKFKNDGTATHEAFIGDQAAQDKHAGDMSARKPATTGTMAHGSSGTGAGSTSAPSTAKAEHGHAASVGDDHGHGQGADEVSVDPGQTGELTYTFDASGNLILGCHEPGHWESGMKAIITVA